ncbi:MAG: ABC transporter permease [Endomicrobiia bacterium]|nr:ABC transporter permease [Endomicrobiia bacterium]
MDFVLDGFKHALALIFPPRKEVIEIALLSLTVSGAATITAAIFAIPAGVAVAMKDFKWRRLLIGGLNVWLAVPAVAVGLFVYGLISRRGPLGFLEILYTPYAMAAAQALLAFPIIFALTVSALKNVARETSELARAMGASRLQTAGAVIKEGRFAFASAIIMGFARVVGETGMTLMLGGNIKGETRVLTTAIALETMKGNFETGLALGIILIIVALAANAALQVAQGK